jgi:hypothetical protein
MPLSYRAARPESTPMNIFRITQLGRTALPITLLLIPHGLAGLYSLSNFPIPHGLAKVYFSSYRTAQPEGTPIAPFCTTWLSQGVLPLTTFRTTQVGQSIHLLIPHSSAGIYSYHTCSYHTARPKGLPSHLFVPHGSAEGTPIALFHTTWLSRTVLPIALSHTTRVGQSILLLILHSSAGMYSHHNFPYCMSRPEGTPNNIFSYHMGWPKHTSPHTARLSQNILLSHLFVPHGLAGGTPLTVMNVPST